MNIIEIDRVLGIDPGPRGANQALLEHGQFKGTGWWPCSTAFATPGVMLCVLEWPVTQGTDRAMSDFAQATKDMAAWMRAELVGRGQLVYCPPSQRIRYDVAGYSPRRDGPADAYIREWIITNKLGGEQPGCSLRNDHLRDAFMAALWGELVRKGGINGDQWRAA